MVVEWEMKSKHMESEQQKPPKSSIFFFHSEKSTDNVLNGKIKKCQCKYSIKKHESKGIPWWSSG